MREIQEFNTLNQQRDTGEVLPDDSYGGSCNRNDFSEIVLGQRGVIVDWVDARRAQLLLNGGTLAEQEEDSTTCITFDWMDPNNTVWHIEYDFGNVCA